jgi:superfamily II RNA helicase
MVVGSDPRAKLTRELRELIVKYEDAARRSRRALCEIFLHTYSWIDWAVTHERARNQTDATKRLASTLGRSQACILAWYYCGRFMHDNKISYVKADARSVRTLALFHNRITKSEMLRCISLTRGGRPYSEVMKILRKSRLFRKAEAELRAQRLGRDGKLTSTVIKTEMHTIAEMAKKRYGDRFSAVVVFDKDDNELLIVGGE